MIVLSVSPDQADWRKVLDRDGFLVAQLAVFGSADSFVLRAADVRDWIVSVISEHDSKGLLAWEEFNPFPYHYKSALPGTGWSVYVEPFFGGAGYYIRLEKGREWMQIQEPADCIMNLYHRIYERFGHELIHLSYSDAESKKGHEKEQVMLKEALRALGNMDR